MIPQEAQYRDWMLAALAGEAAAYRSLLSGLTRHLRGYYARRLGPAAAEDVVQETLIAMHTRRVTYDPAQPFTAWTHAIARYKLIDFWRRRRRRTHVALDDVAGDLWSEEDHGASEAAADLDRLLADLPERQQGLIRDVKIEGLSLAEAGARRGMTEGAAKVSLHRALKALTMKVGRADG